MTAGGVPSLKALYTQDYSQVARWFEIYVREAHPGQNYPALRSFEEKMAHARDFKRLEGIPWPVLVDDVEGTVHRAYGKLPNSAYVIDAEGRIAFKDQWASAPALRNALDALRDHGGYGAPVAGGMQRRMSLLGPIVFGWHAIERAGDPAGRDALLKMPPMAVMMWLGQFLQPFIAPVAKRTRPLPNEVKVVAILGLAVTIAALALRRRH